MKPSDKMQENSPVDQPVGDFYSELLDEVKRYWMKGQKGDLNQMVKNKSYEAFNWTKGYFRTRVSMVLNGKVRELDLLQAMYDHIEPKKISISKAIRDRTEITMQRVQQD